MIEFKKLEMNTTLQYMSMAFATALCLIGEISAKDAEIPRVKRPDPRAAAKAASIERYDKNKNGKLDNEEIETMGRDRMLANDRNKDGRVDQVELRAMAKNSREKPPMDALQRAMAVEKARADARAQQEKDRSKSDGKPAQDKEK